MMEEDDDGYMAGPDDMIIIVGSDSKLTVDPPKELTQLQELIVVMLSDLAVPTIPPKEEMH